MAAKVSGVEISYPFQRNNMLEKCSRCLFGKWQLKVFLKISILRNMSV